ncbi:MAG: hypothetical protein RLZZ24_31, partial [Pseudomonadota bacterium]
MIAKPNTVVYTSKAARQLRKLPRDDSLKILRACASLVDFPAVAQVRALSPPRSGFRLR